MHQESPVMISQSTAYKHYNSAKHRFLTQVIINFLSSMLAQHYGPVLLEKMAIELINLFEQYAPEASRLKPGQILWTALDKRTRGDSPKRKFVPVVLTLISKDDVDRLTDGERVPTITKEAYARMFREAYDQGGILSTRDISLLTLRTYSAASMIRSKYELEHQCVLPHTGALHDMGSTVSHKRMIIDAVVKQKKDPADVALECNHSQRAVDKYLNDYGRVKTACDHHPNLDFISRVTGISKHVVKQYLEILEND